MMGKIVEYLTLWGPTAHISKKVLGKSLHQKIAMYPRIGYWPQINSPRSFNEKVMYRKLFTNENMYSRISDKHAVREYVTTKCNKKILNQFYQVVDDPENISFISLPDEFVIKPTHGSGWVHIVENKSEEDFQEIRSKCREWLSQSYGETKGEYWYNEIEPRIIIEERLKDDDGDTPPDYKFFVFHGEVKYVQVDYDRFSDHSRRFYDRDWNPQDFKLKFPLGPVTEEPDNLDDMIRVAEKLGEDFDFIRVDLYNISEDEIVFGELTLAPESGGGKFDPRDYDFQLGSHW